MNVRNVLPLRPSVQVRESVLGDFISDINLAAQSLARISGNSTLLQIAIKLTAILALATLVAIVMYIIWLIMEKRHLNARFQTCVSQTRALQRDFSSILQSSERLGRRIDKHTNRRENSRKVSYLVYTIAKSLNVGEEKAALFFCAALVYDAGFLDIEPDLFRMEILSGAERKRIKTHVQVSTLYYDFIPKEDLSTFYEAATLHHENMDGSGYPEGLLGQNVPLIARIIHVAESFVSLTSKRTYHKILSPAAAVEELRKKSNIYDSRIVESLAKIVK